MLLCIVVVLLGVSAGVCSDCWLLEVVAYGDFRAERAKFFIAAPAYAVLYCILYISGLD